MSPTLNVYTLAKERPELLNNLTENLYRSAHARLRKREAWPLWQFLDEDARAVWRRRMLTMLRDAVRPPDGGPDGGGEAPPTHNEHSFSSAA